MVAFHYHGGKHISTSAEGLTSTEDPGVGPLLWRQAVDPPLTNVCHCAQNAANLGSATEPPCSESSLGLCYGIMTDWTVSMSTDAEDPNLT